MIFLLTERVNGPTMDDVGEMPDPSRPPAPQIAALVDRARRRDPAAFRDLFQAHVGSVHRVVRRMVSVERPRYGARRAASTSAASVAAAK